MAGQVAIARCRSMSPRHLAMSSSSYSSSTCSPTPSMSAVSPPKSSFEMDDDVPPRLAADKTEPPLKKTLHTAVYISYVFLSIYGYKQAVILDRHARAPRWLSLFALFGKGR